jgi:divalent metal cation (Fe/Co/Zn/Cd) transporter
VDTAYEVLGARPGVQAVRKVRMRWIGHRLNADVELDVNPALSLAAAHDVAHDAEHELSHALPRLDSVIVHAYPGHEGALNS